MRRSMRRLVVAAGVAAFAIAPLGHAAGVVTCPPTEASLRSALVGGGLVTFSCSGTIALTSTIIVSGRTTIDATKFIVSGLPVKVTAAAGVSIRLIEIPAGAQLTIKGLNLTGGVAPPTDPNGGAIANFGTLTAQNTIFGFNSANSGGSRS